MGARKRVANNITRLLDETNNSLEALCRHLGSKSMVYDGRSANKGYTLDTLGRIADFFNRDIVELFEKPEKRKNRP